MEPDERAIEHMNGRYLAIRDQIPEIRRYAAVVVDLARTADDQFMGAWGRTIAEDQLNTYRTLQSILKELSEDSAAAEERRETVFNSIPSLGYALFHPVRSMRGFYEIGQLTERMNSDTLASIDISFAVWEVMSAVIAMNKRGGYKLRFNEDADR
jgi:hypothetical protein